MKTTRRTLHANPELSFFEKETAALVVARLQECGGYEITENVAPGHGVVALLRCGGGEGPTIALRADLDALPIHEVAGEGGTKDEFCSKNEGVMHACGHDGHVAILLGVARVLAAAAPKLRGTVKLIFQPAEENAHPDMGPYGGAHEMVAAGVLESPHVDQLYGLHLWSYEPVGTVSVANGPVMAACDTFHINVIGQGGHGATPHHCIDCVVVCAALVMQLQTIVSRS
jgi:amidohydrolase